MGQGPASSAWTASARRTGAASAPTSAAARGCWPCCQACSSNARLVGIGERTIPGAIGATRRLLDHPRRPSAIFCANDEMAIGCMHAVKAAGLEVPQDLSIAGFDDIRYAAIIDPPLTTVRQPAREIGERVIYLLLCEIEGGHGRKAKAEIVPHELVIRQSVAPPRSGHH